MKIIALSAFALFATLFAPSYSHASQEEEWKDMAPAGWKVITAAEDVQTADGSGNAVLVIEKIDPANRIQNEGLGAPELNTNPRHLLFVTRTKNVGRVTARAENFLPPEGSTDSPCLADPLTEGGVSMAKGIVTVSLQYWMSCGSYGVTNKTYKFRLQGGRYRLIGYDNFSHSRSTMEAEETSINYLTGRRKRVTGMRMDEKPGAASEKTIWSKIPREKFYLDAMNQAVCDDYENAPSWCGG
jgi:hypothetical protein